MQCNVWQGESEETGYFHRPFSQIRKIAVLRALFLGDLLCAIPALRLLRSYFPTAEITLIGLPWAEEMVRRLPYLDSFAGFPGYAGLPEVHFNPEETSSFLNEARLMGYDLAIQMHGNGSITNGFVAELGARITLGYRSHDEDRRLTISIPYDEEEHEIVRWLQLVERAGGQKESNLLSKANTEFPITDREQEEATRLLSGMAGGNGPLIGLHAGAKISSRRWPQERFAELGDALIEQFNAHIVLTGIDEEREITAAVRQIMRYPVLDLTGKTDLGTFASVIAQLDLLVTNDTGASHLAAVAGIPSVVIFGPSRPEHWAPLDRRRHRIVDALILDKSEADPEKSLQHLPVVSVLTVCRKALAHLHVAERP